MMAKDFGFATNVFRADVWLSASTAPVVDRSVRTFRVTHPFHPWKGREFTLIDYRKNWGEDRVFFDAGGDCPTSLPARWTDALAPDPIVAASQGRSPFRADDLLELGNLLRRINSDSHAQAPDHV